MENPQIPHVSVIIPVYNVGKYIEKCARSIFEQTLGNLEIIFVDDCSPDNSVDIINQLLEKYPHRKNLTHIIRTPTNSGLAAARLHGIIAAKGEYIIHCDGDDWVDSVLYDQMYRTAIAEQADIVVCDMVDELPEKTIRNYSIFESQDPKKLLKEWYSSSVHMSCCNKLVKHSIYKDNNILPWPGINMWEDNGLMTRIFYFAKKIVHIPEDAVYHYNRMNNNAITSGYGLKQVEQMISIAENLSDFFQSKPDSKEFEKTVDAFKYLARINLITDSFRNYNRYKRTFPESAKIKKSLDPDAFSTKGKIRFFMVKFGMAPLFILLFKIKNLQNQWSK